MFRTYWLPELIVPIRSQQFGSLSALVPGRELSERLCEFLRPIAHVFPSGVSLSEIEVDAFPDIRCVDATI